VIEPSGDLYVELIFKAVDPIVKSIKPQSRSSGKELSSGDDEYISYHFPKK
jgi:hypothetical protein